MSYCNLIVVLDALGKPGSGLFKGNFFWPGSFSECEGMKKFQYCLAGFSLKMYTFSKKIVDVSAIMLFIFHIIQKLCFVSCISGLIWSGKSGRKVSEFLIR